MKQCPFCAEEIQDQAVKCKHCGERLLDTRGVPLAGAGTGTGGGAGTGGYSVMDTMDLAATAGGEAMRVGRVLADRYEVLSRLGAGGMGEVWKARDRELDMIVAVKVLPPILARNPRSIEALRREAALSLRLTHPGICRLYNFHSDGETKFLVMEFIEGRTLEATLDELPDRRMSLDHLLPIARRLGSALSYVHSQKPAILHRDIKPGNIMVMPDGTAKLLDLGIAREMKDAVTRTTGADTSGTLLYMSPEQFTGEVPSPASDIYSLSASFYECLAGHPPFHQGAVSHQLLNMEPSEIPGLAPAANTALLAGLAKKPAQRPQTAEALVAAMEGHPAGGIFPMKPPPPLPARSPAIPPGMPSPVSRPPTFPSVTGPSASGQAPGSSIATSSASGQTSGWSIAGSSVSGQAPGPSIAGSSASGQTSGWSLPSPPSPPPPARPASNSTDSSPALSSSQSPLQARTDPVPTNPPDAPRPASKKSRQPTWIIAAVAIAAVLFVAAGVGVIVWLGSDQYSGDDSSHAAAADGPDHDPGTEAPVAPGDSSARSAAKSRYEQALSQYDFAYLARFATNTWPMIQSLVRAGEDPSSGPVTAVASYDQAAAMLVSAKQEADVNGQGEDIYRSLSLKSNPLKPDGERLRPFGELMKLSLGDAIPEDTVATISIGFKQLASSPAFAQVRRSLPGADPLNLPPSVGPETLERLAVAIRSGDPSDARLYGMEFQGLGGMLPAEIQALTAPGGAPPGSATWSPRNGVVVVTSWPWVGMTPQQLARISPQVRQGLAPSNKAIRIGVDATKMSPAQRMNYQTMMQELSVAAPPRRMLLEIDFTTVGTLSGELIFDDPASAAAFAGGVRQAIAQARDDDAPAPVLAFLQRLKVTAKGTSVALNGTASAGEIVELVEYSEE